MWQLFALCLLACGQAGSGTYNDPAPTNATLLAQAQIVSQNGYSPLSGSGFVYQLGPSSYLARLQGLSMTWETGLQVRVFPTSSMTPIIFSLKGNSGSQNYPFTATLTSTSRLGLFSSLCIFSTTTNKNYGCALF